MGDDSLAEQRKKETSEMPILSIIVPVYKTEAYLPQCVESLLAQTIRDLEVILVDDGSPDKSGEICDVYAARYPNIQVIHKENEGQTATRKAGIRVATGKYIAFVDSDDWVDADMFQVLIQQAEQHHADIVAAGFVRDYKDRAEPGCNAYPSGVYTGDELRTLRANAVFYLPEMAEGIAPALWAKVFRRETVAEGILSRNDTIRFGEDSLCTNSALSLANCVVIDNDHWGYHYRIWDGSVTQAYNPNYFQDLFILYDELKKIRKDLGADSQQALSYNYANLYLGGVLQWIGRGNPAGYSKKYRDLKGLCGDHRLKDCMQYVQVQRFPGRLPKYLTCMEKNRPGILIACHLIWAMRDKAKRLATADRK